MSYSRLRITTKALTCALITAAVVIAAACSPNPDSTVGPSPDGARALAEPTDYTGPEAGLPTSYPSSGTAGERLKIGYVCAACQLAGVALASQEAREKVESLGGEFVLLDAGGDPQKQLNQFKQLVAQGAQAIIVQPLVETAMAPAFVEASAAGIPVITIASPGDTTKPLLPGVRSNVTFGLDKSAFDKAQYLALTLPLGAEIGVIGFGVPSDSISYGVDRTIYWAEQFGLNVVQQSDVSEITANAAQVAGTALLQRNPNLQAIIAPTDLLASGAYTAARQLGKPNVMVCGNDYDKAGYTNVATKNGSCTVRWNWEDLGGFAAEAAYSSATTSADLPQVVTTGGGVLITRENFESIPAVG